MSQLGRCAVATDLSPPLLRWAGSKKRQFLLFKDCFPKTYNSYVEPFAGSAAFLFRLRPENAHINDINTDLCDFYLQARTKTKRLYNSFTKLERNASTYYETRARFNSIDRGFTRSVYFYFLNRNCFNGIYRTNKSGEFNVPFSDERVSPYLSLEDFAASADVIKRCSIDNEDFETFCRSRVGRNDFVFLDPPYYRDGSRIFNEYGASVFAPSDFQRLTGLLAHLDKIKAKFLLTFPRTRDTIELAKHWNSKTRYVRRTVASSPEARRKQSEMLIYNYSI